MNALPRTTCHYYRTGRVEQRERSPLCTLLDTSETWLGRVRMILTTTLSSDDQKTNDVKGTQFASVYIPYPPNRGFVDG